MTFRPVTPGDYQSISILLTEAFERPVEQKLVQQLRIDGDLVFEMVYTDKKENLIGYIAFSQMQNPAKTVGLAPMAVAKSAQQSGIGTELGNVALIQVRDLLKPEAIFVLGDPAYYTRFGFSIENAARFETVYPKDYFMVLGLGNNNLENLPTNVRYAKAFEAL